MGTTHQERIGRYVYRLWGWDDGSILFGPEPGARVVQDYPDLMDAIIALCDEYFRSLEAHDAPPSTARLERQPAE